MGLKSGSLGVAPATLPPSLKDWPWRVFIYSILSHVATRVVITLAELCTPCPEGKYRDHVSFMFGSTKESLYKIFRLKGRDSRTYHNSLERAWFVNIPYFARKSGIRAQAHTIFRPRERDWRTFGRNLFLCQEIISLSRKFFRLAGNYFIWQAIISICLEIISFCRKLFPLAEKLFLGQELILIGRKLFRLAGNYFIWQEII